MRTSSPTPTSESVPDRLGDFLLGERVRSGPLGNVHQAQHERSGKPVAIKLLPPFECDRSDLPRRFRACVNDWAQLSHPRIVTLLDVGEQAGLCYLVMEHSPGRTLSQVVREHGPLGWEDAVDYTLQAATALIYAHGKGVAHRDIRPSNMILGEQGGIKLLDFGLHGIEQRVAGDAELEALLHSEDEPQQPVGEPTPQQLDLYRLGCTLYFLLTGKAAYSVQPQSGPDAGLSQQPIPDLAAIEPPIPELLQTTLRRLLLWSNSQCFESAQQVVDALTSVLAPSGATVAIAGESLNTDSWSPELLRLVRFLVANHLLTLAELQEYITAKGSETGEAQFTTVVNRLAGAGKLTAYQASLLGGGDVDALVYGDYILRDKLAAGHIGFVFLAQHRKRPSKTIALRILPARLSEAPDAAGRLKRDLEPAMLIKDRRLARTRHVGFKDGQMYVMSEFLPGGNLVGRAGTLTLDEALGYAIDIAGALSTVHEAGFVHGSVKPSNLMLDRRDRIKLTDLGLASFCYGMGAIERPLMTPREAECLAPEAATDPMSADARSDIYSLGCVLFFLITGRPMYAEKTRERQIAAHREDDIPELSRLAPRVPAALQPVFAKLVAKVPSQRYATIQEAAEALAGVRKGQLPAHPQAEREPQANEASDAAGERKPTLPNDDDDLTPAQQLLRISRISAGISGLLLTVALIWHALVGPLAVQTWLSAAMLPALVTSLWQGRRYIAAICQQAPAISGALFGSSWAGLYWLFGLPGCHYIKLLLQVLMSDAALSAVAVLSPLLMLSMVCGLIAGAISVRGAMFMATGLFTPAVALACALAASALDLEDRRSGDSYRTAVSRFEMGMYTEALVILDELLEQQPDFAPGYEVRGRTYEAKGQLDEALADFDRGVKLDPLRWSLYMHRGDVFQTREQPDRALQDFNRAVELTSHPEPVERRARFYLQTAQMANALQDFTSAIASDPKDANNYLGRATAYERMGHQQRADEDRRAALQLITESNRPRQ